MDSASTAEDPLMRKTIVPGDEKMYISSVGWECPRCGSINNPLLPQCFCRPSQGIVMSSLPDINIDWDGLSEPWAEAIADAMRL